MGCRWTASAAVDDDVRLRCRPISGPECSRFDNANWSTTSRNELLIFPQATKTLVSLGAGWALAALLSLCPPEPDQGISDVTYCDCFCNGRPILSQFHVCVNDLARQGAFQFLGMDLACSHFSWKRSPMTAARMGMRFSIPSLDQRMPAPARRCLNCLASLSTEPLPINH